MNDAPKYQKKNLVIVDKNWWLFIIMRKLMNTRSHHIISWHWINNINIRLVCHTKCKTSNESLCTNHFTFCESWCMNCMTLSEMKDTARLSMIKFHVIADKNWWLLFYKLYAWIVGIECHCKIIKMYFSWDGWQKQWIHIHKKTDEDKSHHIISWKWTNK